MEVSFRQPLARVAGGAMLRANQAAGWLLALGGNMVCLYNQRVHPVWCADVILMRPRLSQLLCSLLRYHVHVVFDRSIGGLQMNERGEPHQNTGTQCSSSPYIARG